MPPNAESCGEAGTPVTAPPLVHGAVGAGGAPGLDQVAELNGSLAMRTRCDGDVTELELLGGVEKRDLVLAEHDPAWAGHYAIHEEGIGTALGAIAVAIEHIGSTSVPGLAAKPIIDILVTVRDITAEEDYLDPLMTAGYILRIREPGHRMMRTEQRDVHIHLLGVDDAAAADYLLLRDHLRVNDADRELYETTKRDLVTRDWPDTNAYTDAKTDVIEQIKERARSRLAGDEALSPIDRSPRNRQRPRSIP